jgi:hypothetical protein
MNEQDVQNNETQIKLERPDEGDGKPKTEDKVIIHTMPKRFYVSSSGYDKSKKVGIIIMAVGLVFLIGISVFLYFFFIKSTEEKINIPVTEEKSNTKGNEVKNDFKEEEKNDMIKEEQRETAVGNNGSSGDTVSGNTDNEEDLTDIEKELEEESNENIMDATSTEEIMEEEQEVEEIEEIKEAADSDNDGLSDKEEALFGSIVNLRDSDGDGYEDLSELLSLYNPAGEGSIIINSGVEKYTNIKNSYSLYYAKQMSYDTVGGSEDSMMFKFPNGHIIQVIVEPNSEKLSIEEWYKQQFGVSSISNSQRVYKKGWTGVRSEDGLVVYLTNPASNNIYTLAYNIAVDNTLVYKNVFELMINSLELN